jgi:diadenosine tetraphosphate (Ap4A) HIT family hydrolase
MENFDHNLCPFCNPEKDRIIINGLHALAITDGFPVSDGHALIIPRRHIQTVFDATDIEQTALMDSLTRSKSIIDQRFSPDGYNIGINQGQAGGQTVPHLHIHLIPRYESDQEDPRGGIRWVLPEKACYWT